MIVDWPLVLAGDAAPDLWLLVSRTGWFLAPMLAFVLAARLASVTQGEGRRAGLIAGAIAALGVLALNDPQTSWTRQMAGGLGEPILLALVLAAVELHLRGRLGGAWACGVAAALLRPEAWIPLALYGAWLLRRRALRAAVLAGAVAIPAAWFLPDLIASGSALTGAERAVAPDGGLSRLPGAALDGLLLAPLGLLLAALPGSLSALRERSQPEATLAGLAAVWFATALGFTLLGFAGLPRFFVPFAGLVCVLGSAGLVRIVLSAAPNPPQRPGVRDIRGLPGRWWGGEGRTPRFLAGLLVVVVAVGIGWRLAQVPGDADDAAAYAETVEDAFALVDEVGRDRILGCGPVTTSDVLTQSALTWKLDVGLARTEVAERRPPRRGVVVLDSGAEPALREAVARAGWPLGEAGGFSAYEISCSAGSGRTR